MRVVLVGADLEENLGVGMIAACAERAGHRVDVVPFDTSPQLPRVAESILAKRPDVVGLSAQFQHRSHDFLSLSRELRARGYQGHVTAGGQFPTMAFREVLSRGNGIDSVVLHEGEETFVELLDALANARPLDDVAGLALPNRGMPYRTPGRALADLDSVPFPKRYRGHARHLGVPFIPIMGSRGCWGSCSYCSITTFYRDARAHGGGKMLRHRTPENIAREMALLTHAAGGRGIFCFHDDNFLLPRPADSAARVQAILDAFGEYSDGKVALIGKCRPDSMTPELARTLARQGVIRLYIGVENAAQHGADALNRKTQTSHVRGALRAAREAGIFCCYNLLLFEPTSTLDDIRENIRFIRDHAEHPVNFCRAEPYHGTPMHDSLAAKDALTGSYFGWDYRVENDRAELLFRICAAAFRDRNFACDGVGNRYMGLGYSAKVLQFFHGEHPRAHTLAGRARELTRRIAGETADLLEEALEIAAHADLADHDGIARETAILGLKIVALDRVWHRAMDELQRDMRQFVEALEAPVPLRPKSKLLTLVQQAAFASALSVWSTGCGGEVSDPVPSDTGIKDTGDGMVSDPLPHDTGFDFGPVDALPPDTGFDFGPADPLPPDTGVGDTKSDAMFGRLERPIDQWQDTTPKRSQRTRDLALWDAPQVTLSAKRVGDQVVAQVCGGPPTVGTRWQAEGSVDTLDGRTITWTPSSADDRLAVAVRSEGGITVLALRARDV